MAGPNAPAAVLAAVAAAGMADAAIIPGMAAAVAPAAFAAAIPPATAGIAALIGDINSPFLIHCLNLIHFLLPNLLIFIWISISLRIGSVRRFNQCCPERVLKKTRSPQGERVFLRASFFIGLPPFLIFQ
jgi:hypothetical protein